MKEKLKNIIAKFDLERVFFILLPLGVYFLVNTFLTLLSLYFFHDHIPFFSNLTIGANSVEEVKSSIELMQEYFIFWFLIKHTFLFLFLTGLVGGAIFYKEKKS